MKFALLLNPKRPKISLNSTLENLKSQGLTVTQSDPDIAVIIGGDGTFGYYGRKYFIPMLFVGVRESQTLGSKARLAEVFYDNLVGVLKKIDAGLYSIEYYKMISITVDDKSTDILTDVYLERGIFSGCLRYKLVVSNSNSNRDPGNSLQTSFTEEAIGNGVIISTSFGSGGYYSYLDRISSDNAESSKNHAFKDDKIGICHIIPPFLTRRIQRKSSISHHIRYTIPFESLVTINLAREADARLYGTTANSKGIAIHMNTEIIVRPSRRRARIVKLS